jgi:hypothetical protein
LTRCSCAADPVIDAFTDPNHEKPLHEHPRGTNRPTG